MESFQEAAGAAMADGERRAPRRGAQSWEKGKAPSSSPQTPPAPEALRGPQRAWAALGVGPAPAAIRIVPQYLSYILRVHYRALELQSVGKPLTEANSLI